MQTQELNELLEKLLGGRMTIPEIRRMEVLLHQGDMVPAAEELVEALLLKGSGEQAPEADRKIRFEDMMQRALEKENTRPARTIYFLRSAWLRYAAILLLIAGAGKYLYVSLSRSGREKEITKIASSQHLQDVAPGGNKAVLTLDNGDQILLDSAAKGRLAGQGNAQIIKTDAGSLAYNSSGKEKELLYNTLTTPKGGQYHITLADGTKVWLNAASSIRFPATFGSRRTVTITGEAYLEVAEDRLKPFEVISRSQTVQVVGTSFNINAYDDETAVKSTLIDGAIIVKAGMQQLRLQPGQQSVMAENLSFEKQVDVAQVIAWKNGSFNFDRMTVQAAMKQIARWYDVEIRYSPEVAHQKFGGQMGRNLSLKQVLNLLEGMDMHFVLKEKTLYVNP